MNIFSNIGITEVLIILLLALIVVGPERLPEMGRKLGEVLRDVRRAYENLTSDLGPELMSIQKTTQELRDTVTSVTSIPQDMVQSVVQAAELDDTIGELKGVADSVSDVGKSLSSAGKVVQDPVNAAVSTARSALQPSQSAETSDAAPDGGEGAVPDEALDAAPIEAGDADPDDAIDSVPDNAEGAVPAATEEHNSSDSDAQETTHE
jgi:sec-independent protein translocase protein TatB